MGVGIKFQSEAACIIKDFLVKIVLYEGIYRSVGWDLVFKEQTEEEGTNRSRI